MSQMWKIVTYLMGWYAEATADGELTPAEIAEGLVGGIAKFNFPDDMIDDDLEDFMDDLHEFLENRRRKQLAAG